VLDVEDIFTTIKSEQYIKAAEDVSQFITDLLVDVKDCGEGYTQAGVVAVWAESI
jgi:hypothetical protein